MSRQVSYLHPPGWGLHSHSVAGGDELIYLKHAAKWAVEGSPLPPGGAGEGRGGVSGGNGCYEFDSCLRSSHLRKALFQSSSLYPPVPNSQYLISPPYPPTPFHPRRGGKGSLNSPFGRVFKVGKYTGTVALR